MNRNISRLAAWMLTVMLCMAWMVPAMAQSSEPVEILFLGTSDIHGQMFATDYTVDVSKSGTYRQGLTRVATYIKEMRAQHEHVFLADAGDTIQGTPLSYYYAFYKGNEADPCVKALRALDYDMWVLGNHEFNYGMEILQHQLSDATAPATEGEDTLWVSMANYLDAATNSDAQKDWATWMGYEPYRIYDYDGVKVAVMGIGNPNIPQWDVPANWEGICFANPIETYLHYEAEMDEQSDVIVLVSHSGIDHDAASDFIRALIEQTSTIDLVFSGHEHRNGVTEIANAQGSIVPVISPSTKANAIGQARVTVDKATGTKTVAAEVVSMREYPIDTALEALLLPYEQTVWNDYLLQPIGKATGDFTASGLGTAPSAFVDLVNRVQLWGAYDQTGLNTPNDPSDDTPAQLSITAPLTSGDAANLIPAGDIVLGDMFRLYRYENWFYQITMSGREVRTWLEFSASKLGYDESGELVVNGGLTYYDVIYGDGFSYDIDVCAEAGSRIASMTYNGVEVQDDDTFTVVVNNYRYNGGGDYIQYLNDHGCPFTPNDAARIIYSTQYDMVQGEDLGQARNLLAEYIRQQGEISPDITSTWKLINLDTQAK
ncbi:MAG: bifunctional metallophosphatase/5'-nucleotidase [Aristaeellaceae bacterium]